MDDRIEAVARIKVSCGLFMRPRMRALFDYNGLDWKEHRSLLRSHFVARGTDAQVRATFAKLREWKRELES